MNVLLVITNINGTYSDAYSFGLASIASITRDKGFGYDCVVINEYEDYGSYFDLIERLKPKIIGYTSVSSQFMFVKELSVKVKDIYHNDIIQVCGGIHPTIFPESILEAEGLDGIFIGEGERAFSDFLDRIANDLSYRDVKNFAYNDNGSLVKNSLYPLIVNLDELPFPERDRFGYERFMMLSRYTQFMFSRGCPFNCSYCSNHAIAKAYGLKSNRPRYRSPERCIAEIKQVVDKYPSKGVYVTDDTFGLNKTWMKEFCVRYAEEIGLPLLVQLRVDLVNEEMMEYLKRAGCVWVNCGVESGNDYIRNEIMRRHITREQIINAYALFREYGFGSNAINMIGLPGETVDSIWDTIRLNKEINPTSSGVNIFYPYRGTDLGEYCFANGLVDEERYGDFSTERRETILRFDQEFKDKLSYFYKNWQFLVYRYTLYNRAKKYVRDALAKHVKCRFPRLWNIMRRLRILLKL